MKRCAHCKGQIVDDATVCAHCDRDQPAVTEAPLPAPAVPAATVLGGMGLAAAGLVAVALVAAIAVRVFTPASPPSTRAEAAPPQEAVWKDPIDNRALLAMPSSTNVAHDMLMALGEAARARHLATISREDCPRPSDPFYAGRDQDRSVVWNVRCGNGRSYLVRIQADGTTKALACATAATLGAPCYRPLGEK